HLSTLGTITVLRYNQVYQMTDGEYQFHIHRELPNLIRVKMASTYRSGTSGSRTLGCCAHIVSVMWYFGIGRYLQNLKYPGENIATNLLDVRTRRQI
ncbi:unnamed protein product, partial [Allacma fusca]